MLSMNPDDYQLPLPDRNTDFKGWHAITKVKMLFRQELLKLGNVELANSFMLEIDPDGPQTLEELEEVETLYNSKFN